MPSPLLRFYRHQGPDHAGRMLAEIWHWPYSSLEAHHDYIQWLFPLDTPSGANARAPILTEEDIAHWQHDPMLRMYLRRSFEKLLDFYGFAIINNNGHARIIAASNAATRQQAWITPGQSQLPPPHPDREVAAPPRRSRARRRAAHRPRASRRAARRDDR
ncbi:MAG: opioid growth factor receptor-related protein [Gemmatimonadales bacterium]